jgi:hypothetical protein
MPYNPWFAAMGEDGEPAQKCTPTLVFIITFCSLGASLARKGFFIGFVHAICHSQMQNLA